MAPLAYSGYFTAAATAAGSLIGLLFVAVSLRDDAIFGPRAVRRGQALAITAVAYLTYLMFTSLAVALQRAWSLMKRRHLTTQGAASAGAREAPAD